VVIQLAASDGASAQGGLILGVAIGAFVVLMWLSLRSHPYKACPRCKGRGRSHHPLFPWAYRPCPRCTGGRVNRVGAPGRK
jgi:hypothetical protein